VAGVRRVHDERCEPTCALRCALVASSYHCLSCRIAVLARSLADSVRHGDFFGLFRDAILFEVTRPVKTHAAAGCVAVVVGLACGVGAAAFTWVTLKWRANACCNVSRST
jgi:hypothetical protein